MADIGLFYASSTGNCQTIANLIALEFVPYVVDIFDVMHTTNDKLKTYSNLIFGTPTWEKFELHEDWVGFLANMKGGMLGNKKIAIYGLGDQRIFPDNFADGMGLLYNRVAIEKCTIIGSWPVTGYSFRRSIAIRNKQFIGLALDEDSQSEMTTDRIREWVKILKKDFFYE